MSSRHGSPALERVEEERGERADGGEDAVVGEEGVLELLLAHHVLREADVELVLRPEDLHEQGTHRREVLHRPRAQDRRLVLEGGGRRVRFYRKQVRPNMVAAHA